MEWIFKNKFPIILGLLIIILYFGLRLPNLTLQPIFADEAIYIRWAQIMRSEPTLRFLSLSDGKTPLFMWLLMPMFKIFSDPLLAGRILSVFAGFFTLLGVFGLSWKVFGKRVAFWSALLYAIVPYSVFFDRMALVDSLLASFTIWSIFFAVWLLKSQRLDLSMILGFLMGFAWLTKTPAIVNLIALPTTILGFEFKKNFKLSLVKLVACWGVSLVIAMGVYNLLRLGPGFDQLSKRNNDYVFSLKELSGRPLDPFIPHLKDLADWFPKLLTWPILIFIFIGIFLGLWKKERMGWVVIVWALIPLFLLTAILRTFTARYLLISIPPLLIMAGYGLNFLTRGPATAVSRRTSSLALLAAVMRRDPSAVSPLASVVLLIIILPFALFFDFKLLTDPQNAPLPKEERIGYFEDWTAGYNFKEIAEFLKEKRKSGPVVVGTEGYFGTLPDGLQIYLDKDPITVLGSNSSISAQLKDSVSSSKVYFVANKRRLIQPGGKSNEPQLAGGKLIMEFPKAKPLDQGLQDAIVVYEVE